MVEGDNKGKGGEVYYVRARLLFSDLQWTLLLLSYSPYNYVVIFAIFFGLNLSCNVVVCCLNGEGEAICTFFVYT